MRYKINAIKIILKIISYWFLAVVFLLPLFILLKIIKVIIELRILTKMKYKKFKIDLKKWRERNTRIV